MSAAGVRANFLPALARALDLLGVSVFALSGALAGIDRGLDLFGVVVIAAITGVGGGTLRDLLLNRHPVFWTRDPKYLYAILLAAAIAVLFHRWLPNLQWGLLVADAFGLSLASLSAARIVETEGPPWVVIVLLGTLSGVTGGVIRDVLTGVVPLLLRKDIYATAAIGGILMYLLLQAIGLKRTPAFLAGIALVAIIRLTSLSLGWQLPVFSPP